MSAVDKLSEVIGEVRVLENLEETLFQIYNLAKEAGWDENELLVEFLKKRMQNAA